MIAPQSSSPMAGHRVSILTVSAGWRLVLALCFVLCIAGTSVAEPRKVYDIDLRAQGVADALNGLSEQTGVPVVFPYDLVKDRKANPVVGRYTLLEALDALLKDTGLSGGLSVKGVLTISPSKSSTPKPGETIVTQETEQNTNKTRHPRATRIAAFFAALAGVSSASAQDTDADSSNSLQMESVVVTAQKREERLQDVPIPVSVLNADALAQDGKVLLRDYFSSVPGLMITPLYESNQSLTIRGITTGGNSTPTVGVVIDDVAFGNPFAQGNSIPDIDPGDLERIEVLRGPQGTLYGANSMGGLLKFVTRAPTTDSYSGRVEFGTESVHNGAEPGFQVRGSANIPLGDSFAVRVSGFRRQDAGYIDDPALHLSGVNKHEVDGARLSALWKQSENLSVNLTALYQHDRGYGVSDVTVAPGMGDLQQNFIPNIGASDRKVQAYSATVKASFDAVNVLSVTGYNQTRYQDLWDASAAYGASASKLYSVTGAAFADNFHPTNLTQEVRINVPIGTKIEWLAGGFYANDKNVVHQVIAGEDASTGRIAGLGLDGIFDYAYKEYAGFTDVTFKATEHFDVQVGGRYTAIRQSSGPTHQIAPFSNAGSLTPVIGAELDSNVSAVTYLVTPRYKLTPDVMVYARLASGYRPGQPNTPGIGAVPPRANPDKTYNYELGVKGDLLDRMLSVDASIYYIDWKDIIIAQRTPTGFGYNGNGGGAKSEGVELAVDVRPWQGFTVSTWGAYSNAVLTEAFPPGTTVAGADGDRLPQAPRFSANLSAQQQFPLGANVTGFVGGAVSYIGDRLSVFRAAGLPRQDFPGYTKADLSAGAIFDSWRVNVYINNVTDRRGVLQGGLGYLIPSSFFYIPPRTTGVSVSKTF
jgi:outer membrane receptor protein involved in Fe transport